jgi:ATP-dependent DNA ligase
MRVADLLDILPPEARASLRKSPQPEWLNPMLETRTSPFAEPMREKGAHWLRPVLVAEIGFAEWTVDGKLRHPRFLGLRDAKPAQSIVRELGI